LACVHDDGRDREHRHDSGDRDRREAQHRQRSGDPHQHVVDRVEAQRREPVEIDGGMVHGVEAPDAATVERPVHPAAEKSPISRISMACSQSGRRDSGPKPRPMVSVST
jgi:hypothetical protein